jgi:hypothetical protein
MGWWLPWALTWPTGGMAQQNSVQVQRQYADYRFGQLHYRVAINKIIREFMDLWGL